MSKCITIEAIIPTPNSTGHDAHTPENNRINAEHRNDQDIGEHDLIETREARTASQDSIIMSEILTMLNGLYFIMLTLLGMAFSVSSSVHGRIPPAATIYSQVFLIYVYVMSCIVLITLLVIISKYSRETKSTERSTSPALIEEDIHGVSFYMRIGMIIFTTGILILFLLILAEPAQALAASCEDFTVNIPLAVVYAIQLVFTILQSYVLFKHHRIILHVRIPLMRFILAHLAATNLVSWSFGVITESMVLFERNSALIFVNASIHIEQAHILNMDSTEGLHHSPVNGPQAAAVVHPSRRDGVLPEIPEIGACVFFVATSINAAEYLAPCIIEYSLVAAGVSFKLLRAVSQLSEPKEDNSSTHQIIQNEEIGTDENPNIPSTTAAMSDPLMKFGKCDKANWGVFLGLGLIAAFMVYLIVLFVYSSKFYKQPLIHVGISGISLCITVSTIPLTIYAAVCISFRGVQINEKNAVLFLDKLLIISTAVCIGIYDIFAMISSASALHDSQSILNFITFFLYFINFVHVVLQGSFLNDGLTRRIATKEAAEKKPARTALTVLMFINIVFWMNKSFRAKIDEVNSIHTKFYGYKAWCILSSFFQPLNIFFSFHASVLFAEIWHHAYHYPHNEEESEEYVNHE